MFLDRVTKVVNSSDIQKHKDLIHDVRTMTKFD